MNVVVRSGIILLTAGALSACAGYRAAPMPVAEIAARYQARGFDADATRQQLERIAPAAEWSGEDWDRLNLFAAALASNPAIAEARARARAAEASARAARAGPAITLTLTAEYARNAPEASPWLYGAASDVPLDIGARRAARISAADFAAIAAGYEYAETLWSVRMDIRRALAERFLTAREVQIGEELARLRARQMAALELRLAAGEVARSEVERVRVEAAADARRLSDAEARALAARAALAQALGVSQAVLDSAALHWDDFDAPAPPGDAAIEAMRGDALLNRGDILAAASGYDQAEADLRGEVARQWPELHIGPGYTWERGLVKLPFSLSIALPPLDLNRSAVAAAQARRDAAGARLEATVAGALGAIDAALAERAAARAALERVRRSDLAAARSAALQADREIEDGAIDRVDWAAAQASWRLAQLAETDALRRMHEADAALENALRRPLEGPELAIGDAGVVGR